MSTIAASTELLRVATAGSVDDGKSTLIGRLLYDSKQVFADQLEHVVEVSRRRQGAGAVDLSLLVDGLRAEREQGITIDVAYRYFATPRRSFVIADTPGHVQYTRNMVTGASTADLAIILIDARKGVLEQSKRHAFIATLLGIPHLVVAINKMDLVDYDEDVFAGVVDQMSSFAARLAAHDMTFIPISALRGDNVVERSLDMPWYDGPSLLYHLEHVHVASDRNLVDVRFPVQWVIRDPDSDYRGYAGQVAGGVLRPGDDVLVLPSGMTTTIAAIETLDGQLDEAYPPMSVTLRLADDLDIGRGDLICRPNNRPRVSREVDAAICWMSSAPLRPGGRYAIKHATCSARAVAAELLYRIDVHTLHRDLDATELGLNDIGRVRLRTSKPLAFDPYARNRATGSFILIDEATNDTVGAGMLLDAAEPDAVVRTVAGERSANVRWEESGISRDERRALLGHRGATVWLTGLPGAGKSTLAAALEAWLVRRGRTAYRLDGDNLRHGLNGNLGFDAADRSENVRRTAHAARLLADAGTIAIVSLVSPYAADRDGARATIDEWEIPFFEVWVSTSLAICEERDPKGLYARARAGEIAGMTGVDDPYEPPPAAELVIAGEAAPELALAQVVAMLEAAGLVG